MDPASLCATGNLPGSEVCTAPSVLGPGTDDPTCHVAVTTLCGRSEPEFPVSDNHRPSQFNLKTKTQHLPAKILKQHDPPRSDNVMHETNNLQRSVPDPPLQTGLRENGRKCWVRGRAREGGQDVGSPQAPLQTCKRPRESRNFRRPFRPVTPPHFVFLDSLKLHLKTSHSPRMEKSQQAPGSWHRVGPRGPTALGTHPRPVHWTVWDGALGPGRAGGQGSGWVRAADMGFELRSMHLPSPGLNHLKTLPEQGQERRLNVAGKTRKGAKRASPLSACPRTNHGTVRPPRRAPDTNTALKLSRH